MGYQFGPRRHFPIHSSHMPHLPQFFPLFLVVSGTFFESSLRIQHAEAMSLSSESMRVTSLDRYPVKGMGPSQLTSVCINNTGETFPDDRRFALLKKERASKKEFDPQNADWIHKENFLCAFSAPELMAKYACGYSIVGSDADVVSYAEPWDDVSGKGSDNAENTQRLLTIWERDEDGKSKKGTSDAVLGPIDLAQESGRSDLASFFSSISGEEVVCVAADSKEHTHQFGNTRSGVKARGDTRTVHIINAETVKQFSDAIGCPLNPSRFRPNIVVDGLKPWAEFDLVGKSIAMKRESGGEFILDIISTTVRCEGVGVDPLDKSAGVLPIPALLSKHFPQHGPYLGVYAVIREGGKLSIGDTMSLCKDC